MPELMPGRFQSVRCGGSRGCRSDAGPDGRVMTGLLRVLLCRRHHQAAVQGVGRGDAATAAGEHGLEGAGGHAG